LYYLSFTICIPLRGKVIFIKKDIWGFYMIRKKQDVERSEINKLSSKDVQKKLEKIIKSYSGFDTRYFQQGEYYIARFFRHKPWDLTGIGRIGAYIISDGTDWNYQQVSAHAVEDTDFEIKRGEEGLVLKLVKDNPFEEGRLEKKYMLTDNESGRFNQTTFAFVDWSSRVYGKSYYGEECNHEDTTDLSERNRRGLSLRVYMDNTCKVKVDTEHPEDIGFCLSIEEEIRYAKIDRKELMHQFERKIEYLIDSVKRKGIKYIPKKDKVVFDDEKDYSYRKEAPEGYLPRFIHYDYTNYPINSDYHATVLERMRNSLVDS